jgi:bifunctional DNA-binding transcriptional regulator/antitoxin component of YhaV-PrlF toxin-antitoxin module
MDSDPDRMQSIAAPLTTVSAKIRALDAAGYARADIARFLGKRYQHVRNVLEDDAQRSAGGGYVLGRADLSGVREDSAPFRRPADDRAYIQSRAPGVYRLVVREDGSILLPREVAEKLNARPGEPVMARLDGDEFNVVSVEAAMAEVQELMKKFVRKDSGSVVERYLQEKYEEVARDEAERDNRGG